MPGVIFATILQMSYVASLCIIVVLAVRLLMKRAPRRFSYMLWMVVLFRLLCPVALSGAVSLLPAELFPQTLSDGQNKGSAAGNTSGDRDNRIDTGGSLGTSGTGLAGMEGPVVPGYQEDNVQLQMAEKENAGQGSNRYITSGGFLHGIENSLLSFMGKPGVPVSVFLPIGSAVWLAGLVLLILYSIIALLRLKQRLTGAVCLRENVLLADHIQTPFVLGLLRPRIYLPSTLGENEREYIILHEKEHIRHLDHVVKAVCFLAVMLHWFNPLAWLFFVLCTRDMEMACDESVMDGMKEDIRKDYSALLLNLASGRKIVNGAPLAFGEGDTKERIRNVLRYHKPAVWVSALAMMTVLGICVGLAVNPAGKSTDGEKSSEVAGGGTHKDEMVSGTVDIETGSGIEDGMSGSSAQNRSSDSGTEDSLSGSDTDHDGTGGTAADGAGSTDIGNSGKDFIPDNRAWPEGITVSADCKSLNQEQATALLGEAQELLTQYVEGRYTLENFTAQFSQERSAQDWAVGTARRGQLPVYLEEVFQEAALKSSRKAQSGSVWIKMTTEFDWTELRTAEDYPNIRGMRQALEDLGPISDAEREYAEEYINGWIFEYEADDPFCKPERFTVNFLVQIDADGSSRLLCQLQYGQAYRIFTAREYFEKYLIYDEDYLWQSGYDVVMREMRDYAERIRKDTSLQLGGNGLAYGYVYKLDAQKHRVTEFRFEGDDADHRTNLILSEDCAFWINYEVGNLHYKKVDLDTFIQAVGDVDSRYGSGRECEVSLVNGKAVGLRLMNYYPEISLYERIPDTYYHENREEGNFKEEAVYRENVLNWTGDEDNKRETIRVYTGNMGDGQSGYITIENKEGDVFYADGDNTARAGWHNIYLGELEGRLYFYQLYDETQGDHGSMAYHAYTVDGYGHVSTISGARFDFSRDSFNEDAFNLWADKMNYYLKDTHLLLGIRDGEVSTRPVSDYDLYEKSALLKRIMQEE